MKCYIVDAFTDKVFGGNPAAVCILDQFPSDKLMQAIAMENNLSETAFAVKTANGYDLRWFTPGGEVDLCGHATLATAFVLTSFIEPDASSIAFQTKSGLLTVNKKSDLYEMNLPAYKLTPVPVTDEMALAIGFKPTEAWLARDLVCVLADEKQVFEAVPDGEKVKKLDGLLLNITARGSKYDCVSRSFGPKLSIAEDPVCGSGHCHIIPIWTEKLGKNALTAYQASKRGGTLYCTVDGERIRMAGKAALYSIAELHLPDDL